MVVRRSGHARSGTHVGSAGRPSWVSIDALLVERRGRRPTLAERVETNGRAPDVSSGHAPRVRRLVPMTVDPDSLRLGPPPRATSRSPEERYPFRAAVDAWLAAGGWLGGKPKAASMEVEYVENAPGTPPSPGKRRLQNQWQAELKHRGWTGRLVRAQFARGPDGEQRFYWWTLPAAQAMGEPGKPAAPSD